MTEFSTDVVNRLRTIEPELCRHLTTCFVEDKEKIVETDAGVTAILAGSMKNIIEDVISPMFVGQCSLWFTISFSNFD